MTEDELLAAFTRLTAASDGLALECLVLDSAGSALAAERWEEVTRLPLNATPRQIQAARRLILRRWRLFLSCDGCFRRIPAQLLLDASLCPSCVSETYRRADG